jgi:hypothetical protein
MQLHPLVWAAPLVRAGPLVHFRRWNQHPPYARRPTRASTADQGVRPTKSRPRQRSPPLYHRIVTPDHIQFRQLGAAGPRVFPLALGCMGMSGMYGHADENESIATIHAALDRGVTLLDTGDFYGMGHNEMLIGRALKGHRDRVLLSVKFGALRGLDGALTRLGTGHIDIYRPSCLDHSVPIEETIGAM